MRFNVTYAPPLMPGQCRICGGTKTPMLDLLYTEEFYGAVYYCIDCVKDMVSCFTKSDIHIETINTNVKNTLSIQTHAETLQANIKNIQKAYDDFNNYSSSGQLSIFDVESIGDATENKQENSGIIDRISNNDAKTTESVNGSDDVSNARTIPSNSVIQPKSKSNRI